MIEAYSQLDGILDYSVTEHEVAALVLHETSSKDNILLHEAYSWR